ncbi:MAG: leucine-rich repeat domain-containing protein [Clostridia bacterium]|nr:leucine-rich repeat domain-containing protein [Clostridia bacterium]
MDCDYVDGDHKELSTIALTSSLTSVGAWAFSDSGLTEISVTGVTTIATGVFNGCYQLGNVELAYGTTSIGDYAFTGSGITEITIPKMVTSIGEWAFVSCIRLADVYYGGTQEEWETIEIKTGNDYLTNATIHYAQ